MQSSHTCSKSLNANTPYIQIHLLEMDALALGMVHMVQEVQSGLIKQSQTTDIQEHIACLTAPNSVCSPRQVSSIFQRNAQSDMLQESFVLVRTEPEGCKDTSSPHF